jgi:ribosomal protein S19E (S16A)
MTGDVGTIGFALIPSRPLARFSSARSALTAFNGHALRRTTTVAPSLRHGAVLVEKRVGSPVFTMEEQRELAPLSSLWHLFRCSQTILYVSLAVKRFGRNSVNTRYGIGSHRASRPIANVNARFGCVRDECFRLHIAGVVVDSAHHLDLSTMQRPAYKTMP